MKDELSFAPDWAALIKDDQNQQAINATNVLDYAATYVNPDDAAQARKIFSDLGVTYGEAFRNPEMADRLHRQEVFGRFIDAHPEHASWIADNADLMHDDLDGVGSVLASAKQIAGFLEGDGAKMIAAGPLALLIGPDVSRSLMQGETHSLGKVATGLGEIMDSSVRSLGRRFDLPDHYDLDSDPSEPGSFLGGARLAGRAVWNELNAASGDDNPLRSVGQGLNDASAWIAPEDQESWINQGAKTIGEIIPFVAAAIVTDGMIAPAVMVAGHGGAVVADETRQFGVYGTAKGDAATLWGAGVSFASMAVGAPVFLSAVAKSVERLTHRFVTRLAVGGFVGAAQGGFEQAGRNLVARTFYDPDRALGWNVPHRLIVGAIGGAALGLGLGALCDVIFSRPTPPTAKDVEAATQLFETNAKALEAKQGKDMLSSAMDAAAASKSAARMPDELAAAVTKTIGDKGNLTLSHDALPDLLARPKLASELGVTPDSIIAAHVKGEGVPINPGRLAVSKEAERLKDGLLDHVRLSKDAMTPAEAAQWNKAGRDAFIAGQRNKGAEEQQGAAPERPDAQKPSAPMKPPLGEETTSGINQSPEALKATEQAESAFSVTSDKLAGNLPLDIPKWSVTREGLIANLPEGTKINPENLVDIRRLPNDRTVWLEIGDIRAGFRHIIYEHTVEFAQKGIGHDQIPDAVFTALESGKIVGYQGKGIDRPIYEFSYNGQTLRLAITVGDNGYIVGVNPYSLK